jgi:ADP-ribosylglycohydrolase
VKWLPPIHRKIQQPNWQPDSEKPSYYRKTVIPKIQACKGQSKADIKEYLQTTFNYDLSQTIDEIRPHTYFDETCQVSVPQAIIAFLDSTDYEDAVRKAVSLGADDDTQACIAGGIAQAFYKQVPAYIITKTRQILATELLKVVDEFNAKYPLIR